MRNRRSSVNAIAGSTSCCATLTTVMAPRASFDECDFSEPSRPAAHHIPHHTSREPFFLDALTSACRTRRSAVAVTDGLEAITFKQLDILTNKLAHRLLRYEEHRNAPLVIPNSGTPVGVYLTGIRRCAPFSAAPMNSAPVCWQHSGDCGDSQDSQPLLAPVSCPSLLAPVLPLPIPLALY